MKIHFIAGARPNYMKIAPVFRALQAIGGFDQKILHTGQHYDFALRELLFQQLGLPEPVILGPDKTPGFSKDQKSPENSLSNMVSTLTYALSHDRPDLLMLVGDVNSTLAGALAGARCGVKMAHVEAGLRSFDDTMPEETNRIAVDSLCQIHFVSEPSGLENLRNEGISGENVHFVGNVMIDCLRQHADRARATDFLEEIWPPQNPGVLRRPKKEFAVATFHRPANVDNVAALSKILEILRGICQTVPVVFPVHPRTRAAMQRFGLETAFSEVENLTLTGPLGYFEFTQLMAHAVAVLTDSGGVQEETTFLGVPCLTFRTTTERPATLDFGTNRLLPNLDAGRAVAVFQEARRVSPGPKTMPPLWDGHAAERIAEILAR